MRRPKIPKQYLGAFKAGHRQSAREFIDEELSYELLNKIIDSNFKDQASMDALAYITKFNNEYYKNVVKKDDPTALHNTPALRKDCYDRQNARNRDIISREKKFIKSIEPMTIQKEGGDMKLDSFLNKTRDLTNHEDVVIALLDLQDEANRRDPEEDN